MVVNDISSRLWTLFSKELKNYEKYHFVFDFRRFHEECQQCIVLSNFGHYWTYLRVSPHDIWYEINDDIRDKIGSFEKLDKDIIETQGVVYLYM